MEVKNFHHPYEPYAIQLEFMTALYECIEGGKVGIFESPTGTGKSLSLICGSLTWLRDHKRQMFEEGLQIKNEDDDEPDWMLEHAIKSKKQVALDQRARLEARLAKIRAKEKSIQDRYKNGEPQRKRMKHDGEKAVGHGDEEAHFLLDDYESDHESNGQSKAKESSDHGLSAETQALMKKLGIPIGNPSVEEDEDAVDELKIIFCSRTHSQLSQFANELRKVKIPPALTNESVSGGSSAQDSSVPGVAEELKHLTLGSRKNLCINPKVNRLGSATAINERCLELQQGKVSADCKCQYLPTKETEVVVNEFRDHALAKIRDIEELGSVGKQLGICPYYASRAAISPSEIVTLPYPLLLQKSAREALDLSLKDHIIIIDEAHNLMDAISGIYSVSVTLAQLNRGRGQLMIYLQKFRNRLKGKNRVYVAQTVRLLDCLIQFAQQMVANKKQIDCVVPVGDLMSKNGVDQINLYKLSRYLQDSKLARKVDGYIVHIDQQEKDTTLAKGQVKLNKEKSVAVASVPVLTHIQGFLLALMNPSAEGRFFFSRSTDDVTDTGISIKYMLLDPTNHFREIVEEARAVILAGGTMSPMSDYIQHLLSYIPSERIMTLSCGHVIPPSNLLAWPVSRTSTGCEFDFTFEKRNSQAMIIDLGQTLRTLITAIPDGVVVFFPSYAYLDDCVRVWKKSTGQGNRTLWDNLSAIKPIFLEARSNANSSAPRSRSEGSTTVESTLIAYTNAITSANANNSHHGALLLAVIGGTMSEGINFSDALGRGVIVVGLPFPNPHSAEWKARTEYVSLKAGGRDAGKAAARDFYENACMRAVNQCVGRAIRHRGDYAAILMLDRRYESARIKGKLPSWIKGSMRASEAVAQIAGAMKTFFDEKAMGGA